MNQIRSQPSPILRYTLGVIAVLILSLGLFYGLMRPPLGDLGLMALFLAVTASISALAGYGAYRLGWIERSPSVHLTLLLSYAVASLLTFFNVWITANLMFASQHDLMLATILLLFAGGIAMVLGYFFASALTDRMQRLDYAAKQIADGNLEVSVPVQGNDEMAALALTFNQMATRLNEAAEKQHQLDTLRRDLVAWAGHDLQTPLASVRAIIEALADGVIEDPDTAQSYLRTAQRDIQNLSLLIDDLFQMAQFDAGGLQLNRETASLSDLVSDTLESFSQLASNQGVELTGNVSPGVDPVFMDFQRIGRVINNLIANAIRHTPEGGQVTLDAVPVGNGIRVRVSDNGEGIPPEDLPKIFERFYRGEKSRSRATGGSGLGLAIAKSIVNAHGGQIGVESIKGEGTNFTFTLPRDT